jgi:leucyl-tRNA synthetase
MDYNFHLIEKKWQQYWRENKTYKAVEDQTREKCYVLDMFPYPSGAGLHVGHPLGYIASDIYARYKRLKGFNVLHPMGYDAFGLPAEQYAIQTGQHPALTTEENIKRYREQLDNIGFSFDWDREVRTCDPAYYKWTQWIFLELFNSWYDNDAQKAKSLNELVDRFRDTGNVHVNAACSQNEIFSAEEWLSFDEHKREEILLNYRLAYISEAAVNWCPALGTVLANEEVKDGVSERGGYPVERKMMKQWSMRITAYAQRLLDDLESIDWPDSLKEQQRNWIGRSEGAEIDFTIADSELSFKVFTTRPDTIFGVSYMTLAPEHELVDIIVTPERREEVVSYVTAATNRSERERMAEVKNITGVFTGAYAIHPFTGKKIPIWIGDYVLAGYGTGAVMAVPGHDSRDYAFAKHFKLPIPEVVSGGDIKNESYDLKAGKLINSDFLNGLEVTDAIKKAVKEIENKGVGIGKINFRLRDAIFGRQRYWGEPIPIYYRDGIACGVKEKDLPVILPEVDKYLPTEDGEPPLARAKNFRYNGYPLETTTMPGWAGSSWYYLRYMDAQNDNRFASEETVSYWKNVDLYMGGAEHATGHLLYVRFWTKFMYDRSYIPFNEPAKKLINQGMIQGRSAFVYRMPNSNTFLSSELKDQYEVNAIHVDVNIVENDILDKKAFQNWREEFKDAVFIPENGPYICGSEIEKMSKSKYNVVNPDEMIDRYGADCLRLYEMFLGPLELAKPWNTNGITGTGNFIRKLWRLFHKSDPAQRDLVFTVSDEPAVRVELKVLHRTIKKVIEDIERFSFNTSVSNFMICVNELTDLKCNKRAILEPLVIIISPYAPHIAEELWQLLGNKESVTKATFPLLNEEYLIESEFAYPVSVNGKTKINVSFPLSLTKEEIEKAVLDTEDVKKLLKGDAVKKVIVVPGRIINIVI